MPNEYTNCVRSGEVTDLKGFAMVCARAFQSRGMPDSSETDSEDADSIAIATDIPEFVVGESFRTRLNEAVADRDEWLAMTNDQKLSLYDSMKKESAEAFERKREESAAEKARYEAMLAKVEAFTPPSPNHEHLKRFMILQLKDAIRWDCKVGSNATWTFPSFNEWEDYRNVSMSYNVSSRERALANEEECVRKANEWVRLLKEALENQQ